MTSKESPDSNTQVQENLSASEEESPQNLPLGAWVTLILFAAVVVAFGSCANTWMFN